MLLDTTTSSGSPVGVGACFLKAKRLEKLMFVTSRVCYIELLHLMCPLALRRITKIIQYSEHRTKSQCFYMYSLLLAEESETEEASILGLEVSLHDLTNAGCS